MDTEYILENELENTFEEVFVDSEWLDYLKRCDEWNEEMEDDDLNKEIIITPKKYKIRKPCFLNEEVELENDFYIIGKVKSPKKPKSFKYNSFKKTHEKQKIICDSVLQLKPCEIKNCKEIHEFSKIPYCKGLCEKITFNNNYYKGSCIKRHYKETFENFVIRKQLKTKLENISLSFYERPSDELLYDILVSVNKLNIKSLEISLCKKPKTLSDFLNKN